jgi:hypothetical protein
MRRADVQKFLENIGVRFKAVGWDFSLGGEGEAVIDDIVGKMRPASFRFHAIDPILHRQTSGRSASMGGRFTSIRSSGRR